MNMIYRSTRGKILEERSAAGAIKQGLCADGGLFMPDELPKICPKCIERLSKMSYPERAADILGRFLTDYSEEELLADCTKAYAEERFPGGAAPIHPLTKRSGDAQIQVLELWHGPTCAFKDMALQIMPRLLSRALTKTGEEKDALILVATSGDTGKAALEGYRDVDRVKIDVFYPRDGVSRIQKLQMATQEGKNVFVQSIVGNFDDAQNGVKRLFSDPDMAKRLGERGVFLSSANSINWGRLAPQIVYYISAYCDLFNKGEIKMGEEMNVCVPTGNFGNIFAAYIAKRMGLPIGKLICASNRNNILTDFFETGTYDRNRSFYTTMSPSMDILISSNLERLLYLVAGSERTAAYMDSLIKTGRYTVDEDVKAALQSEFVGGYADEEATAATIRRTYEEGGYLIDTHTAVAMHCAEEYIARTGDGRKMLVVSTASPYKFAANVLTALNPAAKVDEEDAFAALYALEECTGVAIPAPLAGLKGKEVRFDPSFSIDPMTMADAVENNL